MSSPLTVSSDTSTLCLSPGPLSQLSSIRPESPSSLMISGRLSVATAVYATPTGVHQDPSRKPSYIPSPYWGDDISNIFSQPTPTGNLSSLSSASSNYEMPRNSSVSFLCDDQQVHQVFTEEGLGQGRDGCPLPSTLDIGEALPSSYCGATMGSSQSNSTTPARIVGLVPTFSYSSVPCCITSGNPSAESYNGDKCVYNIEMSDVSLNTVGVMSPASCSNVPCLNKRGPPECQVQCHVGNSARSMTRPPSPPSDVDSAEETIRDIMERCPDSLLKQQRTHLDLGQKEQDGQCNKRKKYSSVIDGMEKDPSLMAGLYFLPKKEGREKTKRVRSRDNETQDDTSFIDNLFESSLTTERPSFSLQPPTPPPLAKEPSTTKNTYVTPSHQLISDTTDRDNTSHWTTTQDIPLLSKSTPNIIRRGCAISTKASKLTKASYNNTAVQKSQQKAGAISTAISQILDLFQGTPTTTAAPITTTKTISDNIVLINDTHRTNTDDDNTDDSDCSLVGDLILGQQMKQNTSLMNSDVPPSSITAVSNDHIESECRSAVFSCDTQQTVDTNSQSPTFLPVPPIPTSTSTDTAETVTYIGGIVDMVIGVMDVEEYLTLPIY